MVNFRGDAACCHGNRPPKIKLKKNGSGRRVQLDGIIWGLGGPLAVTQSKNQLVTQNFTKNFICTILSVRRSINNNIVNNHMVQLHQRNQLQQIHYRLYRIKSPLVLCKTICLLYNLISFSRVLDVIFLGSEVLNCRIVPKKIQLYVY